MHSQPSKSQDRPESAPRLEERLQALAGARQDYPRDRSIPELIRDCARLYPDKAAIVMPDVQALRDAHRGITLTYAELIARANGLAQRLRELGVVRGDRVGLLMNRSIETIVGMCAILDLGAAYVPLDPAYPDERLRFMLEDTQPKIVVTESTYLGSGLLDAVSTLVIQPGSEPAAASCNWATAESAAYIMYTSGSTGKPKGVCVPHRAIVRLVRNTSYARLDSSRVWLQLAPISFDASTLEIWGALVNGGTCVLYPSSVLPDFDHLEQIIRAHGVTSMWLTASLFNLIIDERPSAIASVEEVLTGGEALSVPHVRKALRLLPNTRLINGYGPTENTTFTCCYLIPRDLPESTTSIPIGTPIANTLVFVLDDRQQPVPIGESGELCAGGDGLADGYWQRPTLNDERFVKDLAWMPGTRLYRTGDRVRWREPGVLEFLGRVDDQVKLHGHRIELGEIAAVLSKAEGTRDAAVIMREDVPGEKRLVAYVVPADPKLRPSPDALRRHLKERLPEFMIPAVFVSLDRLPITANGKLDRAALPPPSSARPELSQPFVVARTELEQLLARLWRELLHIDSVGVHDRFFELGGTSLKAVEFIHLLSEELGEHIPVMALFDAPTISTIVGVLGEQHAEAVARRCPAGASQAIPAEKRRVQRQLQRPDADCQIAIVGMAGRFPKAPDIHVFWDNLRNGVEGSVGITADDLIRIGKDPSILKDPDYVAGTFALEHADCFDAAFFGLSPREAELMDPQLRLMLETAWAALEHAGHDPARFPGRIGVFGGVGRNSYLVNQVLPHPKLREAAGDYHMLVGNERDFPTTNVSYRLDLRGPSVDVQSACSTSGVAIHLAAQSLRSGDSDMALAGGCKVICPNREGYWYVEGGPLAPQAQVRAFDSDANGMVRGSGIAMVVLKRLKDAIADGDTIYGLLKGSAVNNDGGAKIGFTAPSIQGQAEVIRDALVDAAVSPDQISYVETHGTGTKLGDPIEVAGLTQAFRVGTARKQFCAVGSVKTNIGHLDAGATAAGVIKTLLALGHEQLPPSLNFKVANPELKLAESPFFVNAELRPWPKTGVPRRAGVSSFGLGGTNAHLVLEEAPDLPPTTAVSGPQLVILSAKTEEALERSAHALGDFLAAHPALDLADVSHTLQIGRRSFTCRNAFVASSIADAVSALRDGDRRRVQSRSKVGGSTPVAFMFPGGGAQYANMAKGLYAAHPTFKADVDRCARVLLAILGRDIREIMFPDDSLVVGFAKVLGSEMESPALALPALFTIEFALARLWMSWGVQPAAMIGHSMGEYTAACLAEVISLEDALALVCCRGRLFETLPEGAMLSVLVDEVELRKHLGQRLSIAAVNCPDACVASGAVGEIDELRRRLSDAGIDSKQVHIRVAAHSTLVEPILGPFREFLATITLRAPRLPFISNVTGKWITDAEATDPEYWVRHLRQTVRFSDGLATLWAPGERVVLEVGPGQTLSTFARQHPANPQRQAVITAMRHPQEDVDDDQCILGALGRLWLFGVDVDWAGFRAQEIRRRIGLPTYPFARDRHWVDAPVQTIVPSAGATIESTTPTMTVPATVPIPQAQAAAMASPVSIQNRQARIRDELRNIVADLGGFDVADVDPHASFLELGFDSLFLARANSKFKSRFGVRMTARQLIERTPSLDAVATFLDKELAPDAFPAEAEPASAPTASAPGASAVSAAPGSLDAIAQQLAALQQQIAAMSGRGAPAPVAATRPSAPAPQESSPAQAQVAAKPDATSPWQPVQAGGSEGLTERQREHLDQLMAELQQRTPESKRLTQQYRKVLSDPRTVQGFRSLWKEIVYPIVSDKAAGSRIWDTDGNEYIDLVNGYGATFFGHCPDFILRAVEEQIRKTVAIGPQTPLAGRVAQQVCELTGMDRAALCNTGSEAVLAAIRMARTVTGKKRLACFSGHYHGIFDEVLVKGLNVRGKRRSVPIAPGIPPEACENVIVMDYGSQEALETIRQNKDEIALVMMEPVRSREPENQPVEFVRQLRKLTEELGIPLLFDEMVTGFRSHPGGVQAIWGVKADIATYGKVAGGGFPIGIVAGSSQYMDALDGGMWNFGDNSQPEADMTWFAGTFVRHPAALAAASAVLTRLKEAGPKLQDELAARTRRFCDELNEHFSQSGAPVYFECFSSWFMCKFKPAQEYSSLLFHHLIKRGIYTYGGRPAFLTTEHSDADMRKVAEAFKDSVAGLQRAGFFPGRPRQRADETLEIAMSDGQQEIWLATRFGKEASLAFNLASTVAFHGELRVDVLQRGIDTLVDRHEALRAIPNADGQTQRILSPEQARIEVPLLDLRSLDEASRGNELQRQKQLEVETVFDFERGPLIRAKIVRTGDLEFELILTAHHIIADGWSCGVLLRELGELYSAGCEGRRAVLSAPMQLSEWVQKCAADLGGGANSEALSYWLTELGGQLPILDIPSDRPRPPVKTFAAKRANMDLGPEFAAQIKVAAAKCNATTFVTLLSAFQVFLHRLSGQDEFIVGFSLAGQSQIQGRDLVGHCVNFLPVRQTIETGATFAAHVGATRGKFLDAMEHQDCTLGTLIKRLRVRRDPSRMPIMSVAFNLDPSSRGITFHGIDARTGSVPRRFENFDIFFNVVDLGDRYQIQVTYNEALWDAGTMQLRMREYRRLLESVMADPTTPVDRLELLDEAERRQLAAWNPPPTLPAPRGTLHQRIAAVAAARAGSVAVVCGEERLSYADLETRANRIARRLVQLGVGRGDLVAVCLERGARLVPALLGILRAGAAYVPLDPMNPSERLSLIAKDARVKVLVTERALLGLVDVGTASVLDLDKDREMLATLSADPLEKQADSSAADLAYVIYTSGSTGVPKGVCVTHGNVLRLFEVTRQYFDFTQDDVFSVFHSYAFDFSVFELWGALLHGGTAVIVSQATSRSTLDFLEVLEREAVTVLCQTPSAFRELVAADAAEGGRRPLPLRFIVFGGESLDFQSLRPWFAHRGKQRTQLINMYGITETTVHTTFRVVTREDVDGGVNARIGVPLPDLTIDVVDRHLQPVPIGTPGEIIVGGRGVAAGYLQRPELTAERFLPDPASPGATRYRSGDIARWLPSGDLEFLGRRDDQVKIRGFRIELGEIESALQSHPSIHGAAARVWVGPDNDPRLLAYIIPESNAEVVVSELRDYLQKSLPPYMVPQHFMLIAQLPRTPSGKLDRRALPEFSPEEIVGEIQRVEPTTDEEIKLAAIWSQMLGVKSPGITDDFFDLGGHSLLAVRMLTRIREDFGIRLSLQALIERPTIASIAERIQAWAFVNVQAETPTADQEEIEF